MSDSFLTDSEDENTVDDIISQAMDLSVLEQIAKLNSSSFDESLPSNLEHRFRKLKSLPTNVATTRGGLNKARSFAQRAPGFGKKGMDSQQNPNFLPNKLSDSELRKLNSLNLEPESESELELEKKNTNSKTRSLSDLGKRNKTKEKAKLGSSDSSPSDSETEKKKSTKSKPRSLGKQKSAKTKVGTGSFISRSDSSPSGSESNEEKVSTKHRSDSRLRAKKGSGSFISRSNSWLSGCLCTPKKKGKENRSLSSSSSSLGDLDDDVDFMRSFSTKEQKKIVKKAMKEEEKVNREADKIVKWAKQYSDRMMNVNVSGLDNELNDFDHDIK